MFHLTLTKSQTSRISRPQTKSPIKKRPSFDLKTRRARHLEGTTEPPHERTCGSTQKLEVSHPHVPAGSFPSQRVADVSLDSGLVVSDVLAGINYLSSIQFPPFPETGLNRHGVADLYNARKVCEARKT